MPYLNCPECRLTLYNPPAVLAPHKCPRCQARLGEAAPTLFPTDKRPSRVEPESSMRMKAERRGSEPS